MFIAISLELKVMAYSTDSSLIKREERVFILMAAHKYVLINSNWISSHNVIRMRGDIGFCLFGNCTK